MIALDLFKFLPKKVLLNNHLFSQIVYYTNYKNFITNL